MKAIQLHGYGFDQLRYEDIPTPQAGPGQVVVRVRAASVNQIDAGRASGALRQLLPLTFPWTPGGDFAGTVEAVGAGVTSHLPGAEVYGTGAAGGDEPAYGGAYAEYIVVPATTLAAKPQSLSFLEAGAVPIVALTAWQGLQAAHLQAGQTVLIHGGAGAVGAFAVQFAHQQGAKVIATAAAEDLDFVRALGANEVIDYHATRFETVVHQADAVLDLVGGDTQQRSYAVLKAGGYLVATSQPPSPEEAAKHGVHGVMFKFKPSADDLGHIAQLLDQGTLKVDVARTYPLAQAGEAWQDSVRHMPQRAGAPAVAAPKIHGKIVLEVA
ncbi:NADP-dependent oxidoreductase, partial [uncultured Hymenobacter sp.]|uniref:NADP-dependent oxidoreductase n=1 Tax=uncultured Hymenobacter sp. TaxID=170016 RepID=UPI0035CB2B73